MDCIVFGSGGVLKGLSFIFPAKLHGLLGNRFRMHLVLLPNRGKAGPETNLQRNVCRGYCQLFAFNHTKISDI